MASDDIRIGLESELSKAVEDLHTALQRAADATASIKRCCRRSARSAPCSTNWTR